MAMRFTDGRNGRACVFIDVGDGEVRLGNHIEECTPGGVVLAIFGCGVEQHIAPVVVGGVRGTGTEIAEVVIGFVVVIEPYTVVQRGGARHDLFVGLIKAGIHDGIGRGLFKKTFLAACQQHQ